MKGSGDDGECGDFGKWWLQAAMKVPRVWGGCGCGRSGRDWFFYVFLQGVVVPVYVVLRVS